MSRHVKRREAIFFISFRIFNLSPDAPSKISTEIRIEKKPFPDEKTVARWVRTKGIKNRIYYVRDRDGRIRQIWLYDEEEKLWEPVCGQSQN